LAIAKAHKKSQAPSNFGHGPNPTKTHKKPFFWPPPKLTKNHKHMFYFGHGQIPQKITSILFF
jgi:hypothetical protein